eukprot:6161406-Prymnesium_polylepis.1
MPAQSASDLTWSSIGCPLKPALSQKSYRKDENAHQALTAQPLRIRTLAPPSRHGRVGLARDSARATTFHDGLRPRS